MKTKKYFVLIIACVCTLVNSCTIYRKGGGTLNEKITKAHYRSYPEYRSIKKYNEKHDKKHGRVFCMECHQMELFRMHRDSSRFFDNICIKQKDTFYMIESYTSPYNNYFLIIWNRIDTASFYATAAERILHKKPDVLYPSCEMQLVGKWDIKGIRYEEDKHSDILGGGVSYATRIIIKRNKYKISCIRYKMFWSYERDKYDVIPMEYRPKNLKCGAD